LRKEKFLQLARIGKEGMKTGSLVPFYKALVADNEKNQKRNWG